MCSTKYIKYPQGSSKAVEVSFMGFVDNVVNCKGRFEKMPIY